MSGVSIDHLISIVVLFAAVLLFIGLFNQTLSVAVDYQRNTSTATACGDLLDAMLLTPGIPPPARRHSNSVWAAGSIIDSISTQSLFIDASRFIIRSSDKLSKNRPNL